ncbi:MAG TPA: putative lipid II flippase FtsW [Candidatus Magasanikbacteria bacterium]|nr:putative lipid II flippase FtsW [Candidatus Magasanikbacteria bacterium]
MTAHKSDFYFIGGVFVLLIFGLLMLFSASSPESYNIFNNPYYFIKQQILQGVIPGLILFFVFSKIDFNWWQKIAKPFFAFSLLLLILVLIPGVGGDFGTARSWFSIFGHSFQPSELTKLALVIFLAAWLAKIDKEEFNDWQKTLLPFLLVLGAVGFLLVKQPDLGTFSVLYLICIVIYFLAGGKILHLAGILLASAGGFIGLICMSSYRAKRILAFLNPDQDALGISYHINQALLAIGSGGFLGLGWGHSRQKFQYLPEVSADSIFAIIGEELGFLICVFFLALLVFIFWRGLKIAQKAPNKFGQLLTAGIVTWFIGQSFLNIGAMVGLLPLTGVPLPLVSHGGTAMVIMLAAFGIVVSVSKQTKN